MLSAPSLIPVFLLMVGVSTAAAQTTPTQTPPAEPSAATPPSQTGGPSRTQWGVRFGPSFTTLSNVEPFDDTAATAAFEPTLNFGGYAAIALTDPVSFQPEILFAARGHRIRDKDAQPITTSTGELKLPAADRVVLVRYLEFPMLLRVSRGTHENTSVYVIGGPAFGLRRSAVIREVADAGRREDIDELVSGTNLSYVVGAGLQHRRWIVDARFTRGMRSIASDSGAVPVKTGAFSVLMGARF